MNLNKADKININTWLKKVQKSIPQRIFDIRRLKRLEGVRRHYTTDNTSPAREPHSTNTRTYTRTHPRTQTHAHTEHTDMNYSKENKQQDVRYDTDKDSTNTRPFDL